MPQGWRAIQRGNQGKSPGNEVGWVLSHLPLISLLAEISFFSYSSSPLKFQDGGQTFCAKNKYACPTGKLFGTRK